MRVPMLTSSNTSSAPARLGPHRRANPALVALNGASLHTASSPPDKRRAASARSKAWFVSSIGGVMLVGVSQAGRAGGADGLGEPSTIRHLLALGYDVSRRPAPAMRPALQMSPTSGRSHGERRLALFHRSGDGGAADALRGRP